MRGEYIEIDGARLYYYAAGSRGSGEPVVFLHGFPTSGHLWRDVVTQMPTGHRLVVVDLLGFGRSDPPGPHALTLEAHADRVVDMLDALNIERACVVGHDVGGGIAQLLAVHAPARVSRLALIDSVGFARWPRRDVRLVRALMPITRRVPPSWLLPIARAHLERGYIEPLRAAHSLSKYQRPFASTEGRDVLMQHLAALDARATRTLGSRLGELDIPTAVLWGAHDPFLPVSLGRQLAEAIPGATFEALPNASHFCPEEAPRPVATTIAALLAR